MNFMTFQEFINEKNLNQKIWLSPPHMSGNELKYINEAFADNWIAPLGPNIDKLEEAVSGFCNVRYTAVVSSGTAAIHLALIIIGVKPGDEVLASTFTFSATINPIIYLGATPVLIDSEPDTWNMSPELLELAIKDRLAKGKKPKAIIPVHLYGMPANINEILTIAGKYQIPVIEDAAEALGSRFDNRPLGSFGSIGILSFNGNKIITTSGGGALLSDSKEIVDNARFLSTQARDKAPHYQHSKIGYNYRMSNVLAGIGRGQMTVIESRVKKRRDNFFYYKKNLGNNGGIKFQEEPDDRYFSNHWLTTLLIDPDIYGTTREIIRSSLEKENIESRPLWKPMHLQPVFSTCPAYLNGVSEKLFNQGICLPSGSAMSECDLDRVVKCIRKCLEKIVA